MAKFEKAKLENTVQFRMTISREPEDRLFLTICRNFHVDLELTLDDAHIDAKITHNYVPDETYTILVSVPFSSSVEVDKIIDTTGAKYFEK
jgi:hypothetical protein